MFTKPNYYYTHTHTTSYLAIYFTSDYIVPAVHYTPYNIHYTVLTVQCTVYKIGRLQLRATDTNTISQ